MNRDELFDVLTQLFNDSELRDLCFHLGIEYDNLSGNEKKAKARELILFCERTNKYAILRQETESVRPDWKTSITSIDTNATKRKDAPRRIGCEFYVLIGIAFSCVGFFALANGYVMLRPPLSLTPLVSPSFTPAIIETNTPFASITSIPRPTMTMAPTATAVFSPTPLNTRTVPSTNPGGTSTPKSKDYFLYTKPSLPVIRFWWNPQPTSSSDKYGYITLDVCSERNYVYILVKETTDVVHDNTAYSSVWRISSTQPCLISNLRIQKNFQPVEKDVVYIGTFQNLNGYEMITMNTFEITMSPDMKNLVIKEIPSVQILKPNQQPVNP